MVIDDYDLLLFDVDGTIAERNGSELLPAARDFFKLLGLRQAQPTRQDRPAVGLVTNQGGVGLRYWMEEAGFGEPEKYPTLETVQGRLQALVAQIPVEVKLYVSYAYQTVRTREWATVPHQFAGQPEWSRAWRKPQPGMVAQAMTDAQVADPGRVLLVGDADTDEMAAINAGVKFTYARAFWEQMPKFLGLEA